MAVMRFDPFRDFDRLTEQLLGGTRGARTMPMEAYRRGDQFYVHLDVPGVRPDDVELNVERNVVSIRASRRPFWQEGDDVLIDETPQGTFTRQLFLGDNLDSGQMQATYDMGVLTLTIPVAEQAKPRRVEISAGSSQPQKLETAGGGGRSREKQEEEASR